MTFDSSILQLWNVWVNNANHYYYYHFLFFPPLKQTHMDSRYSIKYGLKTSVISIGFKEFLWSGNCVPMWFSYGWLQAKILSIFQAVFSALSSFFNGRLQIAILPRTVFLLQWFCRQLQKKRSIIVFHTVGIILSQHSMIPSESWPGLHGIELLESNTYSSIQRQRPQAHFSSSVLGKNECDVTANHLGTREKWWNSRISHASFPPSTI